MYLENPKGTPLTIGLVNIGYDIYISDTVLGLKLATC